MARRLLHRRFNTSNCCFDMNNHELAYQFAGRVLRGLLRNAWHQSLSMTRRRTAALLSRISAGSMRRMAAGIFATLVLASASQALSPAALHQSVKPRRTTPTIAPTSLADRAAWYVWLTRGQRADYMPLAEYLVAPAGFQRVDVSEKNFADWLRHLPIAPVGSAVLSPNGKPIIAGEDPRLAAVIALQPRSGRLLAGSNMLIRLRAEYLWGTARGDAIGFHLTSGHLVGWTAWAAGVRPIVEGRNVRFKSCGMPDASRENFCAYLESLFQCTSTQSLFDDTRPSGDHAFEIGDVFLPTRGKAAPLIVLDAAVNPVGDVRVLLGRCGIPAQTFHVVRQADGSAWFPLTQHGIIEFDGQTYDPNALRQWGRWM